MRIARLRKVTSFFKSCCFMENVCKMRNALIDYLAEEGIRAEVHEGQVVFIFNDSPHFVDFQIYDGYNECVVAYYYDGEEYASLDIDEKTFIADKVNTDTDNHVHMLAYSTSFIAKTSFYFTNKRMLLELFRLHFMEMTANLNEINELLLSARDEEQKHKVNRIGFHTQDGEEVSQPDKSENQVAAHTEAK